MIRTRCTHHLQLLILRKRLGLEGDEQKQLEKYELGFKGEVVFDGLLEPYVLKKNVYHIPNFTFHMGTEKKEIQIDNIVVAGDCLYIFEVKNYQFDLHMGEDNQLAFDNGESYKQLSSQMNYEYEGLRQLMRGYRYEFKIYPYAVFINPYQTIYGLRKDSNILVHSNVRKFLSQNMVENQFVNDEVRQYILKHFSAVSKHDKDYTISVDKMRPGVFCHDCWDPLDRVTRYNYRCRGCGRDYSCSEAIEMLVLELRTLNRGAVITSVDLSRLSGGMFTGSAVRKKRKLEEIMY